MDRESFFAALGDILSYDPGCRGLLSSVGRQDIAGAFELLSGCKNMLIITGFPILSAGIGENDGPIGAAALALAALRAGKSAHIATDRFSHGLVEACLGAVGAGQCPLHCLDLDFGDRDASALAERIRPDLIVAIERPGRGLDGHFHNMRGQVIDHMTADCGGLRLGIPVIAVGDGGNELGMGNFANLIAEAVPHGRVIAAAESSTVALVSGVSNWWGWGMAALLGAWANADCMTSKDDEKEALRRIAQAGGVDGVKGRVSMSVDGIEWGGMEVHGKIKAALRMFLSNGQC